MSIGINDEENLLYMAGIYKIDHSKMTWDELDKAIAQAREKEHLDRQERIAKFYTQEVVEKMIEARVSMQGFLDRHGL